MPSLRKKMYLCTHQWWRLSGVLRLSQKEVSQQSVGHPYGDSERIRTFIVRTGILNSIH